MHGEISLQCADGVVGAEGRLAVVRRQLQEARDEASSLSSAYAAALARESKAAKQAAEAARKAACDTALGLLDEARGHEQELAAAIANFAQHYGRTFALRSAARQAAADLWPQFATLDSPAALRVVIESELLRVSALAGLGRNLPGAEIHDFRFIDNPAVIPTLTTAFEEADRHIAAHMQRALPASVRTVPDELVEA